MNTKYIFDDVPEEEKLTEEYLVNNINRHISELYYINRTFERKCLDFAQGIRGIDELGYLTDNYGVSNPLDIPFIPMLRKRINYLTNKQLQNHLDYIVTCQNKEGIDYKMQSKKYAILNDITTKFNKIAEENKKLLESNKELKDFSTEEIMKELKSKYGDDWQSDIEIAAYLYSQYFIDRYDIKHEINKAFYHFIVTGQPYYRCYIREMGKDPVFEYVPSEELYVDRYDKEEWVKNHKRVVRCQYMTSQEIITRFGHYLNDEERDIVQKMLFSKTEYYNKAPRLVRESDGHAFVNPNENVELELIRVFHVEWISNNPVQTDNENLDLVDSLMNNLQNTRLRQDRYEGWKIEIGEGIYFGCGKSKYVNRTIQNPYECTLSYNGFRYRYRNGLPYSIVWSSRDIQNMYDMTYFQLNTLYASIMPGGPITVEEAIPASYGDTPEERFKKSIGYRKLGFGQLVSISQEGSEALAGFNQWGANIPSNVDGNLIQALQAQLELLEQQLDNLMGITRQSLGELEERDGKGTTAMAITQAEIVNKDLYYLISMFTKQALNDIVNLARITHSSGFVGSYVLGNTHKIFTIDPESFTLADYNIHFSDDFEDMEKLKLANEMVMQALQAQTLDLKKSFDILMEKSIAMKKRAIDRIGKEQQESNAKAVQEMSQQLEEMNKQLEQLQKENERLKQVGDKLKEQEMKLKEQQIMIDKDLKERELQMKENEWLDKKKLKEEELKKEMLQMTDDNPYNNKIKDSVSL